MICDKCKRDRWDVLPRLFLSSILISAGFSRVRKGPDGQPMLDKDGQIITDSVDPSLCTKCCSEMPGRAWMKAAAEREEAAPAA